MYNQELEGTRIPTKCTTRNQKVPGYQQSVQQGTESLRCIKDWISTVLVLTGVHVIFHKRKLLWVYGVISHHIPPGHAHCPAQSHAHTFLIRSCPQSVLTELLICRSNCSHFSSWIQVSLPSTGFSVGG